MLLLAVYAAVLGRTAAARLVRAGGFDPLAPQAAAVETLVVAKRFAQALPLAVQLQQAYPREPLVAYWLARIHHGLNRPAEEADAWEAYVRLSSEPLDACPAWPDAYRRSARPDLEREAAHRCLELTRR